MPADNNPVKRDLSDLLTLEGGLGNYLESCEFRPEQISMLKSVSQSFDESRPLIIEAGTGVGKSLAYLLPALEWAANNEGRVVISTATIALQQQLMDKDIPLAKKLTGRDVKTVLVVGRGNYLCLKRLNEAGAGDDFPEMENELTELRQWADETSSGEFSELAFQPGKGIRERVCCETDSCPGMLCPYHEPCFFMRARRQAASASILVSNHHLLFADQAARRNGGSQDETAVLPACQCIIFDEAHHIENGATALFTAVISSSSLKRLFNRLYRRKGRHISGLLKSIAMKKPQLNEFLTGVIPKLVNKAQAAAEILDISAPALFADSSPLHLTDEPGTLEKIKLLEPMRNLREALIKLTNDLKDGINGLKSDNPDIELQGLSIEVEQAVGGLEEAADIIDTFLNRTKHPEQVFWLELHRTTDGIEQLHSKRAPLSVASIVREAIWESYGTVITVSATLSLGGSFKHWRSRIGADSDSFNPLEGIYHSPFDFSSRVMLGVPDDSPFPGEKNVWETYLVETIASILDLTGGHALILFTSFETLRVTIKGVRACLGSGGLRLLAQGDESRSRLLKRFREDSSSVLFATDSFWEGVDIPGDSLRMVIITRLPFKSPSEPVSRARRDAITASGGNAFLEFTIPAAITRFRQGFGRLMRRTDDYGAVFVLDSRIIHKAYGKLFLDALPPVFKSIKSTQSVLGDLEYFWFNNSNTQQ